MIKPLPALLVSIAAIAVTTAQAAPPKAQISPTAAKTSAVKKVTKNMDSFTLSRGKTTLRAILLDAPPVYDPGGPVCFVEEWAGDESLLADAEKEASKRGAVLARVICAHADQSRSKILTRRGYAVASEWYTAPLPLAGQPSPQGIRPLTAADVPRVLELGEQKRRQYATYSPVFWRVSPLPRETFAPFMQGQIGDAQNVALAHEQDGRVDGFVLANGRGTIDDFAVSAPELWPTVGADLLLAAGAAAQGRGLKSLLVVCGHGDKHERAMLAAQGLTLATDWYVKPVLPEKK